MDSYEALAASYDELTEDVDYERRADFVERLFLRAKRPVKSLLDLACGTGTMTALFARRGYAVTGVDYSPEMLSQAQQKLAALDPPPLLLCQSMPQLRLLGTVDAAICCLDSINYLTRPRDVQRTFARLHDAIAPGGTLVFDVQPHAGGYRVTTKEGTFDCQKLVLAAGLSNRRFVQFAMPTLPVYADKGQVLLVERMPFVMPIPVLGVTQTFGGTTIIGFRHEKAGHHTQVVPSAVASEGKWAIRVWPELGKKRLIRAWAGLRVMPDDSMAIYSRLPGHPNVTLVNTHSAVTMAAAHTRLLPDFILGGELPETAQGMTLKRFGYSC